MVQQYCTSTFSLYNFRYGNIKVVRIFQKRLSVLNQVLLETPVFFGKNKFN
jgi:hypothetical protein